MKHLEPRKPRYRSPRPRSVPRPIEIWIRSLLIGDRWKNAVEDPKWVRDIRALVEGRGCRLILDLARHWREGVFCYNYRDKGPVVLAGGKGRPSHVVTVILHELGHFELWSRNRHPKVRVTGEEEAWKVAEKIAGKHRLPCVASIRKEGLYSYRLRERLAQYDGSRQKTRKRPKPHSWKLEDSKRSALASMGFGTYSSGKKGKRHQKRFLKKSTRRAERREPIPHE